VRKFVIKVFGLAAFVRKQSQSKGVDSRRNQSIPRTSAELGSTQANHKGMWLTCQAGYS